MKVRPTFVAGAAALSLLLATPAVAAESAPTPTESGPTASYIVQFTPGSDRAAEVSKAKALGMQVTYEYRNVFSGMAVLANKGQLTALEKNPNVKLVEADGIVSIDATQVNPTWGLDRTDQRDLALDKTYNYDDTAGIGVTAYIIDTGILPTHTEFGSRVRSGYNAIADSGGTVDCNGHGTHVAGTVGGNVYGMAKKVDLVAIRVLGCNGSGTNSGVIAGMDWAVDDHVSGAAVANMSLGGGASQSTDDAVARMVADGITVVVAAGNSNANACNSSPARAPSAITVGATQSDDARASYSNFGTCLDIFAPGTSITSAWYTGTTATNTISGTSMASPHVAGAAALYLGRNLEADPTAVTNALVSNASANRVSNPGSGSPNRLLYIGAAVDTPPTAATKPAPPTLTSAQSTSRGTATVKWTQGSNGGSALIGQAVRAYNASGTYVGQASASATATSLNIRLTRGASYFFDVVATNSVGTSDPSNRNLTAVKIL